MATSKKTEGKQLNVEVVKLETIKGEPALYIRISNGEEQTHISVGARTYKNVGKMTGQVTDEKELTT